MELNSKVLKIFYTLFKNNKISVENIAFGMGGALLQKVHRDTMRFAMKASYARVNGEWRDVFKDPITDSGKRSKRGRLALIKSEKGTFHTIRESDLAGRENLLKVIYENGDLLQDWTLDEIRQRALSQL